MSNKKRKYLIGIKKNGTYQTFEAYGVDLNDAENSVQNYVGGYITFTSGKDITDEKNT